jgi:hypothetical protein
MTIEGRKTMTEPTDSIRPTPAAIMQLGMGFMASKTLLSAVELGLFSALAEGPLDGETLRRRLGLHERSARDFFDALVALGMIERDASQRYLNTAASAFYLDRSKPSYIGGLLEMMNARLYPYWGSLTEGLKTGQPQNEAKSGGDLFAALYANPARLATFAAAMTGVTLPLALAIAEKFPWRDYKTIIDIGTAQGCLPVQLAAAHPHLAGGGFDLPPVRSEFEAYVARHGLTDRLRFYPGDFMRDPLPAADVLVMGHILHDWDLPTKKRLIAKAHAALAPGGARIVYHKMIDDGRRENAAGLLMSLNMLIETRGGFDYTSADCLGWLREAGFADARVERLGGPHAMAIGHKRS